MEPTMPSSSPTPSSPPTPSASPPLPPYSPPRPSADQEELLNAVYAGNVERMEILLQNPEVRADYVYPLKGTCLEVACRTPSSKSDKVVQFLLKKVKPNVNNIKPEPIHYAADRGNHRALRELLSDKRTKINAERSDGRTALHLAAKNFKNKPEDYSICLELLLECPSLDINRPNRENCTAVREAAEFSGREAVVKMLELRPVGFDLDSHQSRGRTARQAILSKFPDLERLLPPVKVSTLQTSDPQAMLLQGLLNRHLDVFKGLLQQVDQDGMPVLDPDFFYRQPYRTTCINEACADASLSDYLVALLRANANPNLVNVATMKAPIHVALASGNLSAARTLLDQVALDVNVRDKQGDTPLHYVIKFVDNDQQALQLVGRMLKKGADVNLKNADMLMVIISAVVHSRYELVREMWPEANPDEIVMPGSTVRSYLEMVLPLRDLVYVARSGPELRDRLKTKLFLMLYAENCDEFVNSLRNSGLEDPDLKKLLNDNDKKNTFLQAACTLSRSSTAVEVLLRMGVDPNQTIDENVSPPLVLAAERRNYDVMRTMLDVATDRLDVNGKDRKGQTALHVVARNRNLDMVVRLLNVGARLDVRNNLGKEPISTAAMKDLMDMCLQADEKMFPYDVEYRIKLCFGLFVQRQPPASTKSPAATSAQRDVELAPLNGPAQVGISCTGRVAGFCDVVDQSEAARLCYITETHREDCILKHPLVKSFIFLKWPKLQAYYFANLVCVILLTLFLNVFIILGCNEPGTSSDILSTTLTVLTTIFWVGIVIREILQVFTAFGKYMRNKENILDVALITCTACSVFVKWNYSDVRLTFSVVTVLLSWSELFVVSGRLPILSEYMEILKTVTKNFLFFLMWYSILLVSFALCFYLLLRANKNFSTIWLSFFNVITMMLGEVNTDNVKFDAVPFLSYSVFVAFVFLVAIVLLNLLNGLAISGIQDIREAASLLSIRSRVRLIKDIEYSLINIYRRRIPLVSKVLSLDKIMIFSADGGDDYGYIYPNSNTSPYVLIGASERKHSMDQSVLSETMKIIGEKSVATTDTSKATTQTSVKSTIQKIQELLQELHTDASRNTSEA